MKVVYSKAPAGQASVIGAVVIRGGTHWPADDPIVLANPSLFSDDPRVGLQFSVEPVDLREPATREKRSYVRHQ